MLHFSFLKLLFNWLLGLYDIQINGLKNLSDFFCCIVYTYHLFFIYITNLTDICNIFAGKQKKHHFILSFNTEKVMVHIKVGLLYWLELWTAFLILNQLHIGFYTRPQILRFTTVSNEKFYLPMLISVTKIIKV